MQKLKLSMPLAAALLATAPAARAADTGDWIATWAASPQPLFAGDFIAPNSPASARRAASICSGVEP